MKNTSIVRITFIGIIMVLLFVACRPTRRGYVYRFERFVERVERNASSCTKEQWKNIDQQFLKFVEGYKTEKRGLTLEENQKVGHLMARYVKTRLGPGNLYSLVKEALGWFGCLEGFVDEIKDYQSIKQGFIDELQKSIGESPLLKLFIEKFLNTIDNYQNQ